MAITLTIGNRDFSSRLASYEVLKEVTYKSVTTSRTGEEKVKGQRIRTTIDFSLLPFTSTDAALDYQAFLGESISVTFTDLYTGTNRTLNMRLVSNLENLFAVETSAIYWKTATNIQLRQNGVD